MSAGAGSGEPSWSALLAPWKTGRVAARAAPARPPRRPAAILSAALRRSGFARFLEAAGAAGAPLTLVVNDPHREAATREALAVILDDLQDHGAPPPSLLVACGSHRFGAAARRRHERSILRGLRRRLATILWHDARDPGSLAPAGPFRLHRLVAEAPFVVGVGTLEPHYFAGCAGAHKTLTIGVMSLGDIEANHRGALSGRAAPLALDGNPVFEGVRAALEALRAGGTRLFALDLIRVGGRTVDARAGEPLEALRRGLPLVRRLLARTLPEPAELVVARVRPPLDRTLYQADKGIKNVEAGVRDGGVILLDAPCPDGIGIDRFLRLLRRAPDHATAAALVASEGYVLGDHKAVRLRRLTGPRGVRLGIVSPTLDAGTGRALGAVVFRRRREAAAWAKRCLRERGPGAGRVYVVEDAGVMVLGARHPT